MLWQVILIETLREVLRSDLLPVRIFVLRHGIDFGVQQFVWFLALEVQARTSSIVEWWCFDRVLVVVVTGWLRMIEVIVDRNRL